MAALKKNLGGHKFKDDRVVERAVTRWLITEVRETDIDREQKTLSPGMINGSVMAGTTWKCSGRAVQLGAKGSG